MLFINYSKTTYFITQPRSKRNLLNQIKLKMVELTIQEQNNAKYLRIHIDRALKWNLKCYKKACKCSENLMQNQTFCR